MYKIKIWCINITKYSIVSKKNYIIDKTRNQEFYQLALWWQLPEMKPEIVKRGYLNIQLNEMTAGTKSPAEMTADGRCQHTWEMKGKWRRLQIGESQIPPDAEKWTRMRTVQAPETRKSSEHGNIRNQTVCRSESQSEVGKDARLKAEHGQ